jgi:DNA-binding MarR family transcriptional regulator
VNTETDDLNKIVAFCASVADWSGSPIAREHVLERANVAIPASALLLLRSLLRQSPQTVTELAMQLRLHPSTVSQQLRPLLHQKFVLREVDTSDRRVASLSITAAGRRACARLDQVGADEWRTVLAGWSARDRHLLAELVDRARRDADAAILQAVVSTVH